MSTSLVTSSPALRYGLLFGVAAGTLLYSALAFLVIYPELKSGVNLAGPMDAVLFVLQGLVFAGFSPWLLLLYFWGICRLPRDWVIGAAAVVLSLVLHVVVAVVMAHAATSIAALVASVEVIGAVAVVWYWQHNRRRANVKS